MILDNRFEKFHASLLLESGIVAEKCLNFRVVPTSQ